MCSSDGPEAEIIATADCEVVGPDVILQLQRSDGRSCTEANPFDERPVDSHPSKQIGSSRWCAGSPQQVILHFVANIDAIAPVGYNPMNSATTATIWI